MPPPPSPKISARPSAHSRKNKQMTTYNAVWRNTAGIVLPQLRYSSFARQSWRLTWSTPTKKYSSSYRKGAPSTTYLAHCKLLFCDQGPDFRETSCSQCKIIIVIRRKTHHLATLRYRRISSTESSLSIAKRSLISASDTFTAGPD